MKFKDITGRRFGKLTVDAFIERKNSHTFWDCSCDCGNKTVSTNNNLSQGHVKSCGCFAKESAKVLFTTHGLAKTKLYYTFSCLVQRCNNIKNKEYFRYGGLGVKCEWKCFDEFNKDMGESFKKHSNIFGKRQTTIERINSKGNYCKKNCRWANSSEQARNRRSSVFIEYNGVKRLLIELAEEYNIPYKRLYDRIHKQKWSVEKSIKTPTRYLKKPKQGFKIF